MSEETDLWINDGGFTTQASFTELIENQETRQIATVIIFVISAVLVITLIFVIAVFIDCRQQKLQPPARRKRLRIVKIKTSVVPRIGRAHPRQDDKNVLTDNEHIGQPSVAIQIGDC